MKKSKKGSVNILLNLFVQMVFGIIIILGIIFAAVFFVVGYDYVVLPLYSVSQQTANTDEFQEAYENSVESYSAIDFSSLADNIWFFSYFSMVIIGLMAAYKSRTTNLFTFVSMMTYGLMFVLYIFGFFLVIYSWLYNDILTQLFINWIPSLPMMSYWIDHGGIMFLLQASLMLLISVVDFDFNSWIKRRKADGGDFDDEIV